MHEVSAQSVHTHARVTTSKGFAPEWFSGENETEELFAAKMKGKGKPLLIVSRPFVKFESRYTHQLPYPSHLHRQWVHRNCSVLSIKMIIVRLLV